MGNSAALEALLAVREDQSKRKMERKGEEVEEEKTSFNELRTFVQEKISNSKEYGQILYNALGHKEANEQLKTIIVQLLQTHNPPVPSSEMDSVRDKIYEDMAGLSFLRKYLDDSSVEEINIYGAGPEKVEIVKGGISIKLKTEYFKTPEEVIIIVKKMVRMGGMNIDLATPRVDSYMGGGTRISAMIAPVIREDQGAVASIRKQTKSNITRNDLIGSSTAMAEEFELIELCTRNSISGAVVGATGSGKTTLLNYVLADYVHESRGDARIYIIEESRELQLPQDAKAIYTAVVGAPTNVAASDLTKSALRFHPTFICCAEMRGAEALNAMTAAQTGHIVWSTFHASNCIEAYDRLLTMCKMSDTDISEHLLMENLVHAFPLIISTQQMRDHSRKITGIYEAERVDGVTVIGHYIYKLQIDRYDYDEAGNVTKIHGAHCRVGDLSDQKAQQIYDSCGQLEKVQKFARNGWQPASVHELGDNSDASRCHESF